MGNEAIKAGKQIQNAGKTIANAGATLTKAVTIPIAGVATAAVKTAADFEASMSKVGAIAGAVADDEISGIIQKAGEMGLSFKESTDTTETAMNILKAKAQQMGATTSFSASESAEAMQYMAMAGWKTADMMDGIAGIMDLAAASGEDLAATSDIVTDGLTAFGMAAKESGRFADVMAATSSNAKTNVALMGETFKYCASTAGAMGYSIEDISVAIGIMGNAGIKGSMAGTTLKNTIANLAKPTDVQAAAMEKLGISLTDSSGNMKSFAEVMDNLRSSFSGLSETEKAAAATTLAGKQSMAGLLTIVNASTEDFDSLTKAIKGSEGAAETMAGEMLDNLKGQITLLKSAAEGIAITIGDKLLPYIKQGVTWFQTAAEYINNLSDAQVDNILKWAGIAAAVGPAIMVFGKVVTAVGTAYRMFGTITKMIANFGGIMGVITSPAGIVIGVLAGVALAAVLIIKNWDKIKPVIMRVKQWFMDTFGGKIKQVVEAFEETFAQVVDAVKRLAPKVGESLKGGFKTVQPIIKTVERVIRQVAPVIAKTFKDVAQKLSPVFATIGNAVKTAVPIIGKLLANAFKLLSGAVKKAMPLINRIAFVVGDVLVFAVGKVAPVISKLAGAFAKIFQKIYSDTSAKIKKLQPVFQAVMGVVKVVMNVIGKVAGQAFSRMASNVTSAGQTIKQVISGVTKVFSGVIDFVAGVFTGDWRQAWEGVKSIFGGAFEALAGLCRKPINAVISIINNAISGLNRISVKIPEWVPGLGGKSFGINIPTIPQLYKGTDNWQGGAAIIHDRGGEIVDLPKGSRVYPHDKSVEMARKEGERSGTGSISINIQKLADKIEVRSDKDIDRIAEALAYKLKKIAFNTGV